MLILEFNPKNAEIMIYFKFHENLPGTLKRTYIKNPVQSLPMSMILISSFPLNICENLKVLFSRNITVVSVFD